MKETRDGPEALLPFAERLKTAGAEAFEATMREMLDYRLFREDGPGAFWHLVLNYFDWQKIKERGRATFSAQGNVIVLSERKAPFSVWHLSPIVDRARKNKTGPFAVECRAKFAPIAEALYKNTPIKWEAREEASAAERLTLICRSVGLNFQYETKQEKGRVFFHCSFADLPSIPKDPRNITIVINPKSGNLIIETAWADANIRFRGTERRMEITSKMKTQLFGQNAETKQHQLHTLQGTMAGFLVDFFGAFSRNFYDSFFSSRKN